MNENDKTQQEELRESWVDSLLTSAAKSQDHADRIARAMQRIDENSDAPHSVTPVRQPRDPARQPRRLWRWGGIVIAASFLLALFLFVDVGGSSGTAMAAVRRSLNVAAELMTRKYMLQVHYRAPADIEGQIDIDLFVRGHDRFALRHAAVVPGTSFWLGRDGAESWVVPAFGPVLKGDRTTISRWLRSREELDTPYLHITTLLTRMSRGYTLQTLDDEEIVISDRRAFECQHIRAQLKTPDKANLPDTIELWASRESGMAVRMVAEWDLEEGEIGRKSVVLVFQNEEPSLPKDWFKAEGHYEGVRPIIRMDAASNTLPNILEKSGQ